MADLTYPVVLLQQALVLHQEHGTEAQWEIWAAEVKRWIAELPA